MTRLIKTKYRLVVFLTLFVAFMAQQWHEQPSAFLPAGDPVSKAAFEHIIAHGHSHDWDMPENGAVDQDTSTHDLVDHEHPTVLLVGSGFGLTVPEGTSWQSYGSSVRAQRGPRTLRPPIA